MNMTCAEALIGETTMQQQTSMTCIEDADLMVEYLWTVWWILSLLTGSVGPVIEPVANREVLTMMVFELLAAVVFATVLGTVGTLLVSRRMLSDRVDRRLAELREFLEEKEVDPHIRRQIRTHMEHLYDKPLPAWHEPRVLLLQVYHPFDCFLRYLYHGGLTKNREQFSRSDRDYLLIIGGSLVIVCVCVCVCVCVAVCLCAQISVQDRVRCTRRARFTTTRAVRAASRFHVPPDRDKRAAVPLVTCRHDQGDLSGTEADAGNRGRLDL